MSRPITPNELRRFFPKASATTSRRNRADNPAGVHPAQPEPVPRKALAGDAGAPAPGGSGPVSRPRYRITFTVHAVQPCDWDNTTAGLKALQDAIVAAGWLPDDGWRSLEGAVRAVKAPSGAVEMTVVEITRLA